ncbi:hypothetical protein BCIN_16g04900 [Botrytis cinerea B05.10]|uniref:DUF7918 domain-containing protein n=4 Tax=Botryotinia fuckeliana TaxID=40559 RepID=A0A384K7M7_BOTFB|nr:hypothetical protein BCIN_16g04900 [Botrytis cinerea B05.10]ATZ58816.1 hypothetical protein BCIN_16g04900 [Botrytis cinerea B05.10]EMR80964.1 hypothetical protein BcDW1_10415 [Botrytis cinerea BcDW1]
MAILNTTQGEVEVRIKRYPDNTYYDEYIKVERKELASDTMRTRYIVAEPDTIYYIEVTLEAGFDFGEYELISANLYFSDQVNHISATYFQNPEGPRKIRESMVQMIQYADVEVDGEKVHGARFAFRGIEIDENLSDETDIMGIHPDSLVKFSVRLFFYKEETVTLSDDEYDKAAMEFRKDLLNFQRISSAFRSQDEVIHPAVIQPNVRNLWDAKRVDKDSYKKRGINSAVGFSGGEKQPNVPSRDSMYTKARFLEPKMPKRVTTKFTTALGSGTFEYHCRAAEFLELAGIIKYPPPLHCYSWAILIESERKIALAELQDLSKKQWHEDREKETGLILPMVGSRIKSEDSPWEWRHWDKMYAAEKQKAFDKLQTDKKNRQRGITQHQYKNIMGQIVSLDERDNSAFPKSMDKDKDDKKKLKSELDKDGSQIKDIPVANKIKDEKSDLNDQDNLDAVVPRNNNCIPDSASKSDRLTEGSSDEDLNKKKAKLKKMEEDIAQEERVMKKKRERDALQERIDSAESKKRVRKE